MAYHPLTLRTDNVERLSFLPCYPSSFDEQQEALLFANVPGTLSDWNDRSLLLFFFSFFLQ